MGRADDMPFTPELHLRLLLSIDRGQRVRRAVREAVRPGDRVLDAGTGSGLLACLALAAGAGSAVGVDRQHVGLARAVAERNGLADRITFVESDLADLSVSGVDLSQPFDLLLGFIHTNNPLLDEERSRLVFELRDRYCVEDCLVVPAAVRYRAVACERYDWDLFTELGDLAEAERTIRGVYDLDLRPVVEAVGARVASRRSRPADGVSQDWRSPTMMGAIRFPRTDVRMLGAPQPFATFDYVGGSWRGFPAEVELSVAAPGRLTGVVWIQELLWSGEAIWTAESYSPLAAPRSVAAGERLVIETGDRWRATNVLGCRSATA